MSIAEKHSQVTANNAAILENVQKVYDKGKAAGIAESDATGAYETGKAEGIELGKKAEHDVFWDAFQRNGERTKYGSYSFAGYGFTSSNFYPKYDIRPIDTANYMFYSWAEIENDGYPKMQLKQRLDDCGVVLDTSKATSLTALFSYGSYIDDIPTIDCTGLTGKSTHLFAYTHRTGITKIEKVIVSESVAYDNWFLNNQSLIHITFEGVIGQSINFQWSPLSVASMKNIIEHLKNYAGTDNDGVYSLTFSDTCWAALESDSTAPDGDTWENYVYSLGWVK